MIVKNNILLTKNVKHRKSILSKALGLMFTRKKNRIDVFYFNEKKRVDIHMIFVFYPITLIVLNDEGIVIETKNLKPFSFYKTRNETKKLMEYPKDFFNIKKGDKLEIIK